MTNQSIYPFQIQPQTGQPEQEIEFFLSQKDAILNISADFQT